MRDMPRVLGAKTEEAPRGILPGIEAEAGDGPFSQRAETQLRRYLWTVFGFSVIVNLLFLVSPLYMLQVYDRVLSSGSTETLIVLTSIAIFLLLIYIAADGARRRVLARAGQLLGEYLDGLTLTRGLGTATISSTEATTAVSNLSRAQGLLLQGTIAPLFDLPFVIPFLGILWLINPVLGVVGTAGAVVLVILAILTDRVSRKAVEEAGKRDQRAQNHLSHMVRQRAAIVSMGMIDRATGEWQRLRRNAVDHNLNAAALPTFLSATTRSLRQILQIGILGAGAALAVFGYETAGTIIAGSIIMGRGLAPIDQTVAIWRQVILGRRAWLDLKDWVDASEGVPGGASVTPMPRPAPALRFEDFAVGVPGSEKPLLPQMSLDMAPGNVVALLGPSGSGKTSFLQSVAGAWPAHNGTVRLGGRDIASWSPGDRGRFVGYLPQHVELLTGTVFENICRFTDAAPDDVFAAAQSVGCHDMILSLPKGYDTPVGEGGVHLSAGQRQCVGLARAFFGDPAVLLLDEPTAHLDANLAAMLMQRFATIAREPQAERTVTAIIATHDLRLINAADQVMVIKDRRIILSPRDEYLRKVSDLRREQSARAKAPTAVPPAATGEEQP